MKKISIILLMVIFLLTTNIYAEISYEQAKFYEGQYVYITYGENKIKIGSLILVKIYNSELILVLKDRDYLHFIFGKGVTEIKTLQEVFKIK
ncbi:hypothetical protein LCGC14_1365350 [marine sediment metagenome]|uniref:Uncharacterized protein n=1 Tax=marine sediment metagenome TaxID=412755 RepID=A0A0F9MM30_9ZZZZ